MENSKRNILIVFITLFQISLSYSSIKQTPKKTTNDSTNHWTNKVFFHIGINGSLLYNWTAGGESNLSIQSVAKVNLDYKKDNVKFSNELDLIYGLATGHGKLLVKESDLIQLESELNYNISGKVHLSLLTHLTTQLAPGYIYTETDTDPEIKTQYSSFLSPALSHEAIGINIIGESYEFGVSPLAMKQTIVSNSNISPEIYGVEPGKKIKNETGVYFNINGNFKFLKDKLVLDSDIIAFSEYKELSSIDILFKYLLQYKISKTFSVMSSMFLLYDKDIGRPKLIDTDGNGIPDSISESNSDIQIKQILSIGVNLSL
jgi:hypothetical protein